jgi:glycosyltransferase involved in cell wall biosynthesis
MKRVLIITYYWPPSGGAGVQRWLKFVKYLRGYGWEPIVFTPENPEYPETDHSLEPDVPENLTIIRQPIWEPYLFYKRLLGQKKDERISAAFLTEKKKNPVVEWLSVWIRGNLFIPDARKFWIRPASRYLKAFLAANPVDAIVSTGPPHSMHLIAMRVSDTLSLPWLADFRDPWTEIDFYQDLKLTHWADRIHHSLEKNVLQKATAVSVISKTMDTSFKKISGRECTVITNGYDDGDLLKTTSDRLDNKFSIAHIGTLGSTRNPETLWKALQSLLKSIRELANDLEIKLVGKVDHTITASLDEFGLTPYVHRIDYMPHDEVITCQRQSQVLLLIINQTPNAAMILTGKFFEYLASGRPILCLGPEDGDAASILSETQSGLLAGFNDVATMERHVLAFYQRYKQGTLTSDATGIQKYSRKELTATLAGLLNTITVSR